MGRQAGLVKIAGKIRGISYYHSKSDGYLARKPGGFEGERIKKEPRYQQVRNNYTEFATASRAGKMIKDAFHSVTSNVADRRFLSRLIGALVKVVRMDTVHAKGSRNVLSENLYGLKGFEFNKKKPLNSISGLHSKILHNKKGIVVEIDCSKGNKPALKGRRLVAGIAAIDFSCGDIKTNVYYDKPGSLSYKVLLDFPLNYNQTAWNACIVVIGLQYAEGFEESEKWCTEAMFVADVITSG